MAEGGPSRSGATSVAATSQLDVDIVRQEESWTNARVSDALLRQAAMAAFQAAAPGGEAGEVAILLTDDAEMQALNLKWRGKDAATNVLSFPSGEEQGHLGDVVLAYETVELEAKQQNIAIANHAAHLVVHGVLHLLGYDHDKENEAVKMEALETEILSTLGVADPHGDSEMLRKAAP